MPLRRVDEEENTPYSPQVPDIKDYESYQRKKQRLFGDKLIPNSNEGWGWWPPENPDSKIKKTIDGIKKRIHNLLS